MKILTLSERKRLVDKFIAFDYTEILNDPNIFGVVYKITNILNDKVYIGKTSRFRTRMMEHVRGALDERYDKRSCQNLYQAMRTDGIENFISEIIYIAYDEDSLMNMEIQYIAIFKSLLPEYGYNMTVDRLHYSVQSNYTENRSISHMNKSHNNVFYKKNSNPVVAFNINNKICVFCDSCTLFGRYYFKDKHKATFSHIVRDITEYNGWYLLPLDHYKLTFNLDLLDNKIRCCSDISRIEKLKNFKLLYEIILNKDVETIENLFDTYLLSYQEGFIDIVSVKGLVE